MLTDLIFNNPDKLPVRSAFEAYATNGQIGQLDCKRTYYYEGSEEALAMVAVWDSSVADSEWTYPIGATLNEDEGDEFINIWADIATFIDENYFAFVTGERSFDEWTNFEKQAMDMGYEECIAVYQRAYERYLDK